MSLQEAYEDARDVIVALRNEVEARRASEALLAASLKQADAEVERLRALARDISRHFECDRDGAPLGEPDNHLGDDGDMNECWRCYATWALGPTS